MNIFNKKTNFRLIVDLKLGILPVFTALETSVYL